MYKLSGVSFSGAENAPERFFEGSLEEARIEAHLLLKQESRCRICGEESNGAPACWGCWDDALYQNLL